MNIKTYLFTDNKWNSTLDGSLDSEKTLIIVFGSTDILSVQVGIDDLLKTYTKSTIIGCSTSGEIYNNEVYDDSLSVAVVRFNKSSFKLIVKDVKENESFEVGKSIVDELNTDNLKSIFLLCDALSVDGSELSKGLNKTIPEDCAITGGLAGDGVEFNKTWIIVGGSVVKKHISAIGLYGESLRIRNGCKCGWSRFGLERKITSVKGNVLYTLDNKPALELYKRYLGDYASELPASALHFPLMLLNGDKEPKFRAIKAVDEESSSITITGSIEANSMVSFAKANFDELIDGAQEAAEALLTGHTNDKSALCLVVSCIARRHVLNQNVEDELEAVVDTLGDNVSTIGFYSFGEFSKSEIGCCDFHNQSMALTMIYET